MQRTIARLLLLFAFAGYLIPLALAATAVPPHACCIRKNRHCHASAPSSSSQPGLFNRNCCPQKCGNAVTTAQWAHPEAHAASIKTPVVDARVIFTDSEAFSSESLIQQATRAPPCFHCL